MTAALSPDLAIAYVREMSADVRAAVVIGADGAVLAGDAALADAATAFAAPGTAGSRRTAGGVVAVAATTAHTLLVVSGPLAFEGPTLLDVRTAVLAMVGGEAASLQTAPPDGLGTASERAISALARQFT
jgi:hypothetical protein